MELKSVHYIREAENAEAAQELIAQGWTLISVLATTRPNGQNLPCYVLGMTRAQYGQRSMAEAIEAAQGHVLGPVDA
jgi:hypothetical protein